MIAFEAAARVAIRLNNGARRGTLLEMRKHALKDVLLPMPPLVVHHNADGRRRVADVLRHCVDIKDLRRSFRVAADCVALDSIALRDGTNAVGAVRSAVRQFHNWCPREEWEGSAIREGGEVRAAAVVVRRAVNRRVARARV